MDQAKRSVIMEADCMLIYAERTSKKNEEIDTKLTALFSTRGGCRGLKLENCYCTQVSGSLICGEHNAKKIGAPPPWEKLPKFDRIITRVYAKIAKIAIFRHMLYIPKLIIFKQIYINSAWK